MSQVSRKYIRQEKLDSIFSLFFNLIVSVRSKKEAENILGEILTPTEKVMIAKRIACFFLFLKEIPGHQIAESIKLSTSTISYLKYFFNNSKHVKTFLQSQLAGEKVRGFFEDLLIELLYGSLRKGSDWNRDRKIYYQHKKKRQEPI